MCKKSKILLNCLPEHHRGGGERVQRADGALHDVRHDDPVHEATTLLLLDPLRLQGLLLLMCTGWGWWFVSGLG